MILISRRQLLNYSTAIGCQGKYMIREIIVVEGRDDVTAVKAAVEAEVIAVHGFGISQETIRRIQRAQADRGVIVLTDPDFAGETIRRRIESFCPGVRHAYIMREEGTKKNDVGVENADGDAIRRALASAHATTTQTRTEFTTGDLLDHGLMGCPDSKSRRQTLGRVLGIGYGSAGVLLARLNNYNISRADFTAAVQGLDQPQSRR